MVNQVNLGAKIVSDISLRNTKNGTPVADFRVLHKNSKQSNPLFIDIEVWNDEARRVYETVKRGDTVVVVGELRRDVWLAKDDSKQRSKIKITALRVVVTEEARIIPDQNFIDNNESAAV